MKDLTEVNNVAVVQRVKAKFTKGDTPNDNAIGSEISTVDELLLANEQVVYQCMSPRDEDCTYVAPTAKQVTTHQVKHGRNQLRRKLRETEVELAALKDKAARSRTNRQLGAVKAAATKRAQRETELTNTKTMGAPAEVGHRGEPATELAAAARGVIISYNAMVDAQDEFARKFVGYMRMASTVSEVDPTILEKASRWDKYLEFQQLINTPNMNGATPNTTTTTTTTTSATTTSRPRATRRTGNGL